MTWLMPETLHTQYLHALDRVCKVFVEIRTTPIVGAGLRGMPKSIRTVDLVPARCMARPVKWRGTGTPPYSGKRRIIIAN